MSETRWYIVHGDAEVGPIAASQIVRGLATGKIPPDASLRREDSSERARVDEIAEFRRPPSLPMIMGRVDALVDRVRGESTLAMVRVALGGSVAAAVLLAVMFAYRARHEPTASDLCSWLERYGVVEQCQITASPASESQTATFVLAHDQRTAGAVTVWGSAKTFDAVAAVVAREDDRTHFLWRERHALVQTAGLPTAEEEDRIRMMFALDLGDLGPGASRPPASAEPSAPNAMPRADTTKPVEGSPAYPDRAERASAAPSGAQDPGRARAAGDVLAPKAALAAPLKEGSTPLPVADDRTTAHLRDTTIPPPVPPAAALDPSQPQAAMPCGCSPTDQLCRIRCSATAPDLTDHAGPQARAPRPEDSTFVPSVRSPGF